MNVSTHFAGSSLLIEHLEPMNSRPDSSPHGGSAGGGGDGEADGGGGGGGDGDADGGGEGDVEGGGDGDVDGGGDGGSHSDAAIAVFDHLHLPVLAS